MSAPSTELPVGMAGLRYGITQVSLAVRDLDATMALYHRAFGWAPWQVFDHVPPVHHNTELRGPAGPLLAAGRRGLRRLAQLRAAAAAGGAESLVRVHGPARRRGGVDRRRCSWSARMATRSSALQGALRHRRDHEGRHRRPHRVLLPRHRGAVRLPHRVGQRPRHRLRQAGPGLPPSRARSRGPRRSAASPTRSPRSRSPCATSRRQDAQLPRSLRLGSVEDLRRRTATGHARLEWKGKPADFKVRWAETMVGDLNFELIEPLGAGQPLPRVPREKGEGISSIAVMFETRGGIRAGQGPVRGRRHRGHRREPHRRPHRVVLPRYGARLQVHHRVGQRPRPRLRDAVHDVPVARRPRRTDRRA